MAKNQYVNVMASGSGPKYVNVLDGVETYEVAPPRPPRNSDPGNAPPPRPPKNKVTQQAAAAAAPEQPEYLEPTPAARAPPVSRATKSSAVKTATLPKTAPAAKAAPTADSPFAVIKTKRPPPPDSSTLSSAAKAAQEEVLGFDPEDLVEAEAEDTNPVYDLATSGAPVPTWSPDDSYDVSATTWSPDEEYDVGAGGDVTSQQPAWMLTFTGVDLDDDDDDDFQY